MVYEAVRESLRSHVALKVMHPQFRNREKYLRRFRTEARSAARLHHTNIVSVFDYGEHDGVCYYAMQYIAGHSLDKILADVRQLRQEKAGFARRRRRPRSHRRRWRARAGRDGTSTAEPATRRTDALRQTVTLGLLTGHYSIAPPAEASDDGDNARPDRTDRGGERAIECTDQIEGWAEKLALGHGDHARRRGSSTTETASRQLGFEPGRARAVIPPAHEPPPDAGAKLRRPASDPLPTAQPAR